MSQRHFTQINVISQSTGLLHSLGAEERRHGEEEGDDPGDPGRGRRPGHGHHVAVDHGARDGEVPAAEQEALVCTVRGRVGDKMQLHKFLIPRPPFPPYLQREGGMYSFQDTFL